MGITWHKTDRDQVAHGRLWLGGVPGIAKQTERSVSDHQRSVSAYQRSVSAYQRPA